MDGVSGGLWLDSSRLETVLDEDVWSSLSNGLNKQKQRRESDFMIKAAAAMREKRRERTIYDLQVTSRLSFTVPRSLMSTASVCGSGQNRSSISQDTLPTTTWLARLFSSVTLTTETSKHEVRPLRNHSTWNNHWKGEQQTEHGEHFPASSGCYRHSERSKIKTVSSILEVFKLFQNHI